MSDKIMVPLTLFILLMLVIRLCTYEEEEILPQPAVHTKSNPATQDSVAVLKQAALLK